VTYEPLHHKYRPQTFAGLVGQSAIATTLTQAIQQRRIAPAYLFTGARGTGKTSSARILAKSLNCLRSEAPTPEPCGLCDSCSAIASGSALDVIEIDAASNTGVDNIRELIERAQFAPVQGRYKVYVIDECHMLSTAAFNALLKTLEEPPERVVFVLATTDPQRVLPTIISRCQRFDFRRIPLDDMVDHLDMIAKAEAIQITPEALTLVAQISQGGLRDAESLLDQLSLLTGVVTVDRVWDLVGAVPERDLLTLLQAIVENHPSRLLEQVRRLMDRGREPLVVLQNLAGFYRDLLIAKTAPDRNDLVALTSNTWDQLRDLAQGLEIQVVLAGQQHLRACEVQVKNSAQPRLWLEVGLLGLLPSQLTAIAPTGPALSGVVGQVAQATNTTPPTSNGSAAPAAAVITIPDPSCSQPVAQPLARPTTLPPTQKLPEQQPSQPATALKNSTPQRTETKAIDANLTGLWQQVLDQINPPSTQMVVKQQCHLLSVKGNQIRVGVNSKNLLKLVQSKLAHIEIAFQAVLQQPDAKVQLDVVKAESIAPEQTQKSSPRSLVSGSSMASPTPRSTLGPPPAATKVQPSTFSSPAANSAIELKPTPQSKPSSDASLPHLEQRITSEAQIDNAASPALRTGSYQHIYTTDAVQRAARQLADFFNGQVVSLDPTSTWAGGEISEEMPEVEPSLMDERDDEVPF